MAFCQKCGKQIEDQVNNCPYCGALNVSNPSAKSVDISKIASKVKNSSYLKYIGMVAGALVVLVVVISLISSLFGGNYKGAIDKYFTVLHEGDVKNFEKLAPESFWKEIEEDFELDIDDFEDKLDETIESRMDRLEDEYGKDVKVKFKVIDDEPLDEDDLDELKDNLKESYGIPKKLVKKAIEVEVEATIRGDEDEDTDENEMTLVKIDGKWYVVESFSLLRSVAY